MFCAFTRSRYQVSVHRTIGPLVYVELSRSRFVQQFLTRFCMFCAYTRLRYQVNVYRTIGPLVFFFMMLKKRIDCVHYLRVITCIRLL